MFKSNKGFTLVELIVVIAILAILAGVAIPVYNGYIKRAQDASVVTELDAIATAAQAANATEGGIDLIVVSADGKSIKVSGAEDNTVSKSFNDDFILFYGKAGVTAVSGKYGQFTISDENKIDMAGSYTDKGANWNEDDGWESGEVAIDDNKIPGGNVSEEPEVVNPLDPNCTHTWGEWTETKAATCVAGEQKHTCSTCGGWEIDTIAAVSDHAGEYACSTKCKTCGTTITPSASHDYTGTDGACKFCGLTLSQIENGMGWN